jgi:predicted ATPase
MFSRIQTRNYRCLRSIDQNLNQFHALVGPNASGKTTFLDVITLLGDLVRNRDDVIETTRTRSENFEDLLWMGQERSFQLAMESPIPSQVRDLVHENFRQFTTVRYEVEISQSSNADEVGLNAETLWMKRQENGHSARQCELFPQPSQNAPDILSKSSSAQKVLIKKSPKGNDNYYPEGRKSYRPSFRLGPTKSALSNLPADKISFPVCTWFRELLEQDIQTVVLNSQIIRRPSPPGLGRRFRTDGSNLPWVIEELRKDQNRFEKWIEHVRTTLKDIKTITTIEREEDKHRYLSIEYDNGSKIPSWLVSDGTLRLLALTILAYIKELQGVFLIEEPENGIHPQGIETIMQSLLSIYDGQVLIATHSPVALNIIESRAVLCFAKNEKGVTDIVAGDQHPGLRDWKSGRPDLGTLFAAGILS